jgi:hypothetical protein
LPLTANSFLAVGLWRCDLITRQDLCPWLAALYVDDAARGKGLAGNFSSMLSLPRRPV